MSPIESNVKPCFITDTLLWTVALSLEKVSPHIYSKFNPLNTDTLLMLTLSVARPVSVLMGLTVLGCYLQSCLLCQWPKSYLPQPYFFFSLTSYPRSTAMWKERSCKGITESIPWRQSTVLGTSRVRNACDLTSSSPLLQIMMGLPCWPFKSRIMVSHSWVFY